MGLGRRGGGNRGVVVRMKSFLIGIFVFALCFGFVQDASGNKSDLVSIHAIAKNTPEYMLGEEWTDVTVVKSTPLYDFSGEKIAYSVDMKSGDKRAYAIVSTGKWDGPILQFAEGSSPYSGISGIAVYGGLGNYFALKNGRYNDLTNSKELDEATVTACKDAAKKHKYLSKQPEEAKALRDNLEAGEAGMVTTNKVTTEPPNLVFRKLLDAPDWTWYLGCTPTAAGECIKANFPDNPEIVNTTKETLVSRLATEMHTNLEDGTTFISSRGDVGVNAALATYGIIGHSETDFNGTFQQLVNSIDNRRAIIVTVAFNPIYGSHSMAGVGYAQDEAGTHFVVLHTNDSPFSVDGDVYCDYEASNITAPGLGKYPLLTPAY